MNQAQLGSTYSLTERTQPIRPDEFGLLHHTMQTVVHYRKSGLSLNHVVGCPLECAYCIRHSVGAYELKQPRTIVSDEEAVEALVSDKYFREHKTPIQLFNKATDPFLLGVKEHTFNTIRLLDERGLRNHLLVITRYRVTDEDCEFLNSIKNIKLTILVTYSGITDKRIEPISNRIPRESLRTLYRNSVNYKVILYWRPLVPGLNDSDEHLENVVELAHSAHATAFTGLFFRKEMKQYFKDAGLPELYDEVARRKIFPERLEDRVLKLWERFGGPKTLFRKTSCAVSFAHAVPDYNGHFGVKELCDICPSRQFSICKNAYRKPCRATVNALLNEIGRDDTQYVLNDNSLTTESLDEPPRYFLQHSLSFQVHDSNHPHKFKMHGRADIGWSK